jgi:AraC-like DNA-binding protein
MIKPEFIHPKLKYQNSNLSLEEIEKYAKKISHLFEHEKIFKDTRLNLKELSNRLELNTKYVSEIINVYFNKSFISLLNNYRIEESKRILQDISDITIKEVCYDVGFNSRSAFNSTFKKFTGESPSDYQNKINK